MLKKNKLNAVLKLPGFLVLNNKLRLHLKEIQSTHNTKHKNKANSISPIGIEKTISNINKTKHANNSNAPFKESFVSPM